MDVSAVNEARQRRNRALLPPQVRDPQDIFGLLVLYRWLSLVAPLLSLLSESQTVATGLPALSLAVIPNLLITFNAERVNRLLRRHPALLATDLLLVSTLVAITGGATSPYFLYALSPLIAAAFFFHLRGALLAASILAPLYVIASSGLVLPVLGQPAPPDVDWLRLAGNLVAFFLLGGAFGYAATLLSQLRTTSQELSATHRDLVVLHEITAALHTADDEVSVQEKLLRALTTQLGFQQAILGLVDESGSFISGWVIQRRDGDAMAAATDLANAQGRLTHTARFPLDESGGLLSQTLREGLVRKVNDAPCTVDPWLNRHIGTNNCLIVPIRWGIQPLGVLLLDCTGQVPDETRKRSLEAIAAQTAIAIGMMRTRWRRARESAVQEERARIALDIHDVVSQSLFGLAFTLDGTLKLLEAEPDAARVELESALEITEHVRQEIRRTLQDMWSEEVTPRGFQADLQRYLVDVLQAQNLAVTFEIDGDFSALSPVAWRSLYRIAQESLANVMHHAAATEVRVCLDVAEERARLVVRDNGRGFEPDVALAQVYGGAHNEARFGLRGMQKRARVLGGACDVFSRPGAGASIIVDIPAGARIDPGTEQRPLAQPGTDDERLLRQRDT